MTWTTDKPTEVGWYWYDDESRYGPEVVDVVDMKSELVASRAGLVMPDRVCLMDFRWQGPIKPDE